MPGSDPHEEIVDAAAEVFTQQGCAATSTRAIAEAVGVKQASLSSHRLDGVRSQARAWLDTHPMLPEPPPPDPT
jgi:DNA-binding transcriptional regulator YbjK